MTLNELANTLKDMIKEKDDTLQVFAKDTIKNNGLKLTTLIIGEDGNKFSTVINVDQFYEDVEKGNLTLEEVCNIIINTYKENVIKDANTVVDKIANFQNVKDKIFCKLINAESNKELLKNTPHVRMLDLAVVFYIKINSFLNSNLKKDVNMTVIIKNDLFDNYNIDILSIYYLALENVKREYHFMVNDIFQVLKGLNHTANVLKDVENDLVKNQIFVVYNKENLNGSVALLDHSLLGEIYTKKFNKQGFIIIPSSIHELIVIGVNTTDINNSASLNYLKLLVSTINKTEVKENEVLSNNVYYYNGTKLSIL